MLPLVVCVGAWQVRNHIRTGYNGFTSVGAYNLYVWNADYVAKQNGLSIPQAQRMLLAFLPSDFNFRPAAEQVREYKRLAAPLLKKSKWHKLTHLPIWAGKTLLGTNHVHLVRLAFGYEDAKQDEKTLNQTGILPRPWLSTAADKILFLLAFLQVGFVVALGLSGCVLLWKTQRLAAVFFILYTGYFWMIGSCFFGAYARFRAPFEFILCITAGLTAATLLARRKKS